MTSALFVSLIIRTFQPVFSAGTVFFSHNKSAGTVFRHVFSAKRTEPSYGPVREGGVIIVRLMLMRYSGDFSVREFLKIIGVTLCRLPILMA